MQQKNRNLRVCTVPQVPPRVSVHSSVDDDNNDWPNIRLTGVLTLLFTSLNPQLTNRQKKTSLLSQPEPGQAFFQLFSSLSSLQTKIGQSYWLPVYISRTQYGKR